MRAFALLLAGTAALFRVSQRGVDRERRFRKTVL